jgi:hypothetical protein
MCSLRRYGKVHVGSILANWRFNVFLPYFYGKIRAPEFAQSATDAIIGMFGKYFSIPERQHFPRAESNANVATLAPPFADNVFKFSLLLFAHNLLSHHADAVIYEYHSPNTIRCQNKGTCHGFSGNSLLQEI